MINVFLFDKNFQVESIKSYLMLDMVGIHRMYMLDQAIHCQVFFYLEGYCTMFMFL